MGAAAVAALARYTPDPASTTACLLVAGNPPDARVDEVFPNACLVGSDPTKWRVPDDRRFDLAIVSSACALEARPSAAPLLATLRDRHARCVAIVGEEHVFESRELVALGFEQTELGESLLWLFDPDAESRQREWNDARHWANPENFDKYRW